MPQAYCTNSGNPLTSVNGGTLELAGGNFTLPMPINSTGVVPINQNNIALAVNPGGTVDLNGTRSWPVS